MDESGLDDQLSHDLEQLTTLSNENLRALINLILNFHSFGHIYFDMKWKKRKKIHLLENGVDEAETDVMQTLMVDADSEADRSETLGVLAARRLEGNYTGWHG